MVLEQTQGYNPIPTNGDSGGLVRLQIVFDIFSIGLHLNLQAQNKAFHPAPDHFYQSS